MADLMITSDDLQTIEYAIQAAEGESYDELVESLTQLRDRARNCLRDAEGLDHG